MQCHVMCRSKLATCIFLDPQMTCQRGASRNFERSAQCLVGDQLNNCHGWNRSENLRIDRLQQGFTKLRILGIQLCSHSCRKKREPFDHPLDERVVATIPAHRKASRYPRILSAKLRANFADVAQLFLIVLKKRLVHLGFSQMPTPPPPHPMS